MPNRRTTVRSFFSIYDKYSLVALAALAALAALDVSQRSRSVTRRTEHCDVPATKKLLMPLVIDIYTGGIN